MYSKYLIHYNHNHDRLGRFARSAGSAGGKVGSAVLSSGKRKKKTQPKKTDIKGGKKSNNTKMSESDRNRLVKSGSAKEINKHKNQLSNRELESAIKRLGEEQINRTALEKQLSSLANPKPKSRINRAVDWMNKNQNTLKTVADFGDQAIRVYNNYAKINNALNSSSKMPVIDTGKKKKKKKKDDDD